MIGSKRPEMESSGPRGFDDFDLRLGDIMRGERATIGKSLLDVERDLRIKAPYLAAIENGDLTAFDTPSFIAGYVRSYARYLHLDPENSFAEFCAETGFQVAHGMSRAASTAPVAALRARQDAASGVVAADPRFGRMSQQGANTALFEPGMLGTVAVLVGVIGLIGYGGWSVLQAVQRVDLAPVDQAPLAAPLMGALDRIDSDVSPPVVTAGIDPSTRLLQPQALDVPVLVARDGPISAINPQKTGVFLETVATMQATQDKVKVVADVKPGVEILATRPSWIQISSADGTVLFEKILDAGERYAVPALEIAPLLRAGNSSAVYFVVAGETYGPAATGPEVVKNVDLSGAGLTAAYTVADMAADGDLAQFMAQNIVPNAASLPPPYEG
jgi:hypothetical protein